MPWSRPEDPPPQTDVDRAVQIAHERAERVRRTAERLLKPSDAQAMLALDQEATHDHRR
jgi:hypothetical protein